jgi:hypothetical protein
MLTQDSRAVPHYLQENSGKRKDHDCLLSTLILIELHSTSLSHRHTEYIRNNGSIIGLVVFYAVRIVSKESKQ